MKKWDIAPTPDYFIELFRVSKNQIICGANNFVLPPTRGFIVWDKGTTAPSFSQYDYFWTSFNILPKLADIRLLKGFLVPEKTIHCTQKPVKLYEWLLANYAKAGDKILDTHLGSASIAIACDNLGFELVGSELDAEYYEKSIKRIKSHLKQGVLFEKTLPNLPKATQPTLNFEL
jgi:site-specific DNA-methyltransferase (adenine-specific)